MPRPHPHLIKLKTAHQIAFAPHEDFIAYFGGRDVSALSLGTLQEFFRVHPIAHPSDIDFSPDGRRLVIKSTSGRTIIVDATNGRTLKDFRNQKEGQGSAALFSECGQYIVSVSWGGLLSVRDSATAELVFSHQGDDQMLNHLSAPKDRTFFAYSCGTPAASPSESPPPDIVYLHPWPIRQDNARELPQRWSFIRALQVSPSGRYLAVIHGAPPRTLEIYDIETSSVTGHRTVRYGGTGCAIGWSPDENLLATNGDEMCFVFEMPALTLRHEFSMQYPCFLGYSPTGRYFAAGSWKTSFVIDLIS